MRDYFQLHKTSDNGRLTYDARVPHVFSTKKFCQKRVGDRIWLISREGQKAPFSYFLRYAFVVGSVDSVGEGFRLAGSTGVIDLGMRVQLDFVPWFPSFKKAVSFGFGLSPIPDAFVAHFEHLAASAMLSAQPA